MMLTNPYLEYSQRADAVYVYFSEAEVARTSSLDERRNIDYDAAGGVVGIEFLGVSGGIDLRNLPFRSRVEKLFDGRGYPILV